MLIGKKERPRLDMILCPILSVIPIPPNSDTEARFAVTAHGLNDQGMMTVVEIRPCRTFQEARIIYEKIRRKSLASEDAPDYEVTIADMVWLRSLDRAGH